MFFGILAPLCPFLGYFGVTFGVILGHLLVYLPHPLFLWHIPMHLWPFHTFLGYIGCPNSLKWPQSGLKGCLLAPQLVPGHNRENAFLAHFSPFFGPKAAQL